MSHQQGNKYLTFYKSDGYAHINIHKYIKYDICRCKDFKLVVRETSDPSPFHSPTTCQNSELAVVSDECHVIMRVQRSRVIITFCLPVPQRVSSVSQLRLVPLCFRLSLARLW